MTLALVGRRVDSPRDGDLRDRCDAAVDFPRIAAVEVEDPEIVLRRFAVDVVETLTVDSSMLVYREGADFPELVAVSEANQDEASSSRSPPFWRATGSEATTPMRAPACSTRSPPRNGSDPPSLGISCRRGTRSSGTQHVSCGSSSKA